MLEECVLSRHDGGKDLSQRWSPFKTSRMRMVRYGEKRFGDIDGKEGSQLWSASQSSSDLRKGTEAAQSAKRCDRDGHFGFVIRVCEMVKNRNLFVIESRYLCRCQVVLHGVSQRSPCLDESGC